MGFVTTTRVTHATPAALYAHTPHRDWERDVDVKDLPNCDVKDIAMQLIDTDGIQVGGFVSLDYSDWSYVENPCLRSRVCTGLCSGETRI